MHEIMNTSFHALEVLISALAFAGVIYSLYMQRLEFNLARRELKESNDAHQDNVLIELQIAEMNLLTRMSESLQTEIRFTKREIERLQGLPQAQQAELPSLREHLGVANDQVLALTVKVRDIEQLNQKLVAKVRRRLKVDA